MTKTTPTEISAVLADLSVGLASRLEGDLVGVYLYGSLTQGTFNPGRSDVDCIVVTRADLTDAQFRALEAWLGSAAAKSPWYPRLQITFLVRDEILTMDSPACSYQFGELRRTGSDGNPIIWLNVLECGVTIRGAPPESFVPEITADRVRRALRLEIDYLRDEFANPNSEWRNRLMYRAYAVLTVCRILFTHAHGTVTSKPVAARWTLRTVPAAWHPLVNKALAYSEALEDVDLPRAQTESWIEFASDQLQSAARLP